MKKYTTLCIVMLVGSLLGCQKTQLEPHPKHEIHTSYKDVSYDIDVDELSNLIPSALEHLGIEIEHVNQENGNYECLGNSLYGESVSVRAFGLIKGKSVLRIEVKGKRTVSRLLMWEIESAITLAIDDIKKS